MGKDTKQELEGDLASRSARICSLTRTRLKKSWVPAALSPTTQVSRSLLKTGTTKHHFSTPNTMDRLAESSKLLQNVPRSDYLHCTRAFHQRHSELKSSCDSYNCRDAQPANQSKRTQCTLTPLRAAPSLLLPGLLRTLTCSTLTYILSLLPTGLGKDATNEQQLMLVGSDTGTKCSPLPSPLKQPFAIKNLLKELAINPEESLQP